MLIGCTNMSTVLGESRPESYSEQLGEQTWDPIDDIEEEVAADPVRRSTWSYMEEQRLAKICSDLK